jgi:hypothetical protein
MKIIRLSLACGHFHTLGAIPNACMKKKNHSVLWFDPIRLYVARQNEIHHKEHKAHKERAMDPQRVFEA